MAYYVKPKAADWRELATGPEIRASLMAVGEKAKTFAEGISEGFAKTGDYQRSFELHENTTVWAGHKRAQVELANTSDHAILVELYDKHHVMRRTLEALDGGLA